MRQLRGDLPIVAYEITSATANDGTPKRYLDITYLRPEGSDAHAGSLDGPTGGCDIVPTITGVGTDTITVGLKLYWSNPNGYYDAEDDAGCRISGSWSGTMTSRWVDVTGNPTVLTDGPLTDRRGRPVGVRTAGRPVPQR